MMAAASWAVSKQVETKAHSTLDWTGPGWTDASQSDFIKNTNATTQ